MAIPLACPVCGTDKFKAPNRARGKRCRCPECRSSFRLTDGLPVIERGIIPVRPTDPPSPPVNETAVARDVTRPTVFPTPVPAKPDDGETAPPTPRIPKDPGNQFALIAGAVTGVGLILTVVPYGRVGTVLFAGVGLTVGLLGVLAADRTRWWAWVSAVGSAVVLSVVCLAPGWLGLRPWWENPTAGDVPEGQIRAFSRTGSGGVAAGDTELDASQSVWRQDDVEVAVSAKVGPVELTTPKGQKRTSRERYLLITVKVGNKGVERKLSVSTWPLPDGSTVLATADGKALTVPTFDAGWAPVAAATAAGVYPGKSHTQVFVYSIPPAGDVHLTIPAAGIGSKDPAKFVIPRTQFAPVPPASGRPRR